MDPGEYFDGCKCGEHWPCPKAGTVEWYEQTMLPADSVALVLAWSGKPIDEGCSWVQARCQGAYEASVYAEVMYLLTHSSVTSHGLMEFGTLVLLDKQGKKVSGG
jgi:hypothetical protein